MEFVIGIRDAKVCPLIGNFVDCRFTISFRGCPIPMDDAKFTYRDRGTIAVTWKDLETTKMYNNTLANVCCIDCFICDEDLYLTC